MRILSLVMIIFLSSAAHALIDIRLHYGLLASKQNLEEICTGCLTPANAPDIAPSYGLGVDAIVSPPLLNWGFGLRYENLGFSTSSNNIEAKLSNVRTALIVNYRFIDTLMFLGPIATYGLSHSGQLEITDNGAKILDYNSGSASSWSIGLEGGLKLIAFLVGAEVGYQDLRWNNAKSTANNTTIEKDINLSGSYAKIHLGFGF